MAGTLGGNVKIVEYYKIVRFYEKVGRKTKTVKRHVTLEEAQEWCNRPDTKGKGWFDGYTKEEG